MPTSVIVADVADNTVASSGGWAATPGASWDIARSSVSGDAGTVTAASDTVSVRMTPDGKGSYLAEIRRFFAPFDTSEIPVTATILSATLSCRLSTIGGCVVYWITPTILDSSPVVGNDDFDSVQINPAPEACSYIILSGGSITAVRDLHAYALARIIKGGWTTFALLNAHDATNVVPSSNQVCSVETANSSVEAYRPTITVEWEEGGSLVVPSVFGLVDSLGRRLIT